MAASTIHRVLVTPQHVARVQQERRVELDDAGITLIFPEMPRPTLTESELLALLPGCLAAIAMPDAYTAKVLAACAPPLRLIARCGVGFDSVDVDAATARGVWVTTTGGANHDSVADYTLGLILCLLRKLVLTTTNTRSGLWQREQGRELRGMTLGIVGTGRIGREVAARSKAFGMQVIATDLFPDRPWAEEHGVNYVALDTLLASSDVITLHTPASAETRHLLNHHSLERCRAGVYVVNTARGDLIDEAALLDALNSGRIAGAALDVFADEPPSNRALVEHPNVLPFSHCAGSTAEAHYRSANMAIDEVLRVARGEPPAQPVNRF